VRVAVVGAGVVGLATAYELSRRSDVEVRCYEQDQPMAARSIGETRVFRLGHRDPRLVRLALAAESGWARWAGEFGTPLIDPVSTVLSGPPALDWHAAMTEAGAAVRVVDDPSELDLPASDPPGPFVVDERGGVVDVRGTGAGLRVALDQQVRPTDPVRDLTPTGDGMRVDAVSGRWDCDVVLLLAGAGTPAMAERAGISGVPARIRHHHRFTFRLPDRWVNPPCWLDRTEAWRPGYTTYQHSTSTGQWAIGGSLDASDTAWELGAEETELRARTSVIGYVREQLGWPTAEITDVVHCDSMGLGDGIGTGQNGAVLALWGDNLMKFAPVLGDLLARSALDGSVAETLQHLGPAST
jgi:sarcosine oxidase